MPDEAKSKGKGKHVAVAVGGFVAAAVIAGIAIHDKRNDKKRAKQELGQSVGSSKKDINDYGSHTSSIDKPVREDLSSSSSSEDVRSSARAEPLTQTAQQQDPNISHPTSYHDTVNENEYARMPQHAERDGYDLNKDFGSSGATNLHYTAAGVPQVRTHVRNENIPPAERSQAQWTEYHTDKSAQTADMREALNNLPGYRWWDEF